MFGVLVLGASRDKVYGSPLLLSRNMSCPTVIPLFKTVTFSIKPHSLFLIINMIVVLLTGELCVMTTYISELNIFISNGFYSGSTLCNHKGKQSMCVFKAFINIYLMCFAARRQEKSVGSAGADLLSDRQTGPATLLQIILRNIKWI